MSKVNGPTPQPINDSSAKEAKRRCPSDSACSCPSPYKVQTRKGVEGTFELQNGGKLSAGIEYEIVPVGAWAVADEIAFVFEG